MVYLLSAVNAVLSDAQIIYIALVVLIALFTRAAIGFGDAIIAVPLLSLVMDLSEAVPLILFVSTVMSVVSMWNERSHIQFGSLKRAGFMALAGFPLGVFLLGSADEHMVKASLGFLLIALALWYFLPTRQLYLKASAWSYLFGLLAGILCGAYAIRGIVFGIYGNLRGWSPAKFKSTIHSFYLLSSILIPITYFGAGLVTPRVLALFIVLLPVGFIATLAGSWCSGKLDDGNFQRLIWLGLLLLGVFYVLRNVVL